jgi:hypothetical protein
MFLTLTVPVNLEAYTFISDGVERTAVELLISLILADRDRQRGGGSNVEEILQGVVRSIYTMLVSGQYWILYCAPDTIIFPLKSSTTRRSSLPLS